MSELYEKKIINVRRREGIKIEAPNIKALCIQYAFPPLLERLSFVIVVF